MRMPGTATASHLAYGAEVNATTSVTALKTGDANFLFAPTAAGHTPLHWAAGWGRQEVLTLLLASGGNVHAKRVNGWTPLHEAVFGHHKRAAELLLLKGAVVDAQDVEGTTPLHMAAFSTRTANGKLLLQAGADPALKTDAGRDVLSMARKVRADELAGEISLWILKGCKPGKPC